MHLKERVCYVYTIQLHDDDSIPEDTNNTEKKSYKKNKKKLVKVLSTKLSIEDHNEFAILTKLAYQDGQIKRPALSELLQLMIVYLTNACRNEITKGFI
jgi:hypothetical protein